MSKKSNYDVNIEGKKIVSDLIFKVLAGNLCVRDAIKRFPPNTDDISLQCAWHALVHYEADEDYSLNDIEYRKEQIDYLEMIAFILGDGQHLPLNIIEEYKQYYESAPLPESNNLWGKIRGMFRPII